MPNQHGDFIWYDLMTDDADAAQAFYGKIFGWIFEGSGVAGKVGRDYRTFNACGESIGGFMTLTEEMKSSGARPCWMGYINVDDVDASAKEITADGGSIHMEPQDIPQVGRFAFVSDPQGTLFYIMKPTPPADNPDATSEAFSRYKPRDGHCAWNELMTEDPEAASSFYADKFGWKNGEALDMGPIGTYQMLQTGDYTLGAVMKKPEEMPVSAWIYYFRVPDIDAAKKTIKANGGKTLHDAMEIPGGEFTLNAVDPQGAHFALIGPKK